LKENINFFSKNTRGVKAETPTNGIKQRNIAVSGVGQKKTLIVYLNTGDMLVGNGRRTNAST